MKNRIARFLQHPLTKGLNVDDPKTTLYRHDIIISKPFLVKLYQEWYGLIHSQIPDGEGAVVELGSGAGFIKDCIPEVITTDVLTIDGVDVQLPKDGRLPFLDQSLKAILMTDVLHHINTPRLFFKEAQRVVKSGGRMIMVEPWVTPWSTYIYTKFHSEPFSPEAREWEFPAEGPLSGANGALPWILFSRDRDCFEEEFPEWRLTSIGPFMPFAYLLSGGVSTRIGFPGFFYEPFRIFERWIDFLGFKSAMFALCVLDRQ